MFVLRVHDAVDRQTQASRAAVVPPEMAEAPEAHLTDENPGKQLLKTTRPRVQRIARCERMSMCVLRVQFVRHMFARAARV